MHVHQKAISITTNAIFGKKNRSSMKKRSILYPDIILENNYKSIPTS